MVTPRTRANPLDRVEQWRIDKDHVGKDNMPETCPRCGWACTHLVKAYWDSPWNQYGGFCSQCIREAAAKFENSSWPVDPRDMKQERAPIAERPPELFNK